jgi:hypothetical protein
MGNSLKNQNIEPTMTNPTNQTRACRVCRQHILLVAVLVVVGLGCFASGYLLGTRRLGERAYIEGQRQVGAFLVEAIRLGIIQIDYERLAELTTDVDGGAAPE